MKLATGDAKSAAEEMQKCVPTFDLCHFHQAIAQEKAGDKAAAETTRRPCWPAAFAGCVLLDAASAADEEAGTNGRRRAVLSPPELKPVS